MLYFRSKIRNERKKGTKEKKSRKSTDIYIYIYINVANGYRITSYGYREHVYIL